MKNSRLIGGKPKIGIRPIIDGRRGGIRESLEDMTMTMARKVAELYSSELYHSDGTPVECIIADTTIGGVAEAAMAAEKFRNNGVGVVLSVTPCWCYGFETIDMDGEIARGRRCRFPCKNWKSSTKWNLCAGSKDTVIAFFVQKGIFIG